MYRGLISLMPKAKPLLLDLYPNASVAYSLRKLRTAYSGSAIRVRRSSDNTEQDIAFVGNDLDTQTMLDFVGYNLWTYSEEFNNALYVKTNLNVTGTPPYIDVETAPDSTLTGDKIIENATSGSHFFRRETGTIINGASYNISVYLKQAERTSVEIASQISGTLQTCILDLTNGNVSSNGFANTPVVTAEANGWYRFSVTITSGVTSQLTGLRVSLRNSLNQTSYLGDGISGCFVWGTQLSQTSTVKTYQKTVATAGGAGFVTTWYDQSTNANNSTQATAANQAQVVLNGNLILDVDTNKITTTWTTDRYTLTTGISANTKYLSVSMFRRENINQNLIHLGNSTGFTPTPLFWRDATDSNRVRTFMNNNMIVDTIATLGRCIFTSLKDSTNLKVCYRNGIQLASTATEAPAVATFNVFGQSSATIFTSGQYQEYVYWDSEQSANRTGIETDINTYWNAY